MTTTSLTTYTVSYRDAGGDNWHRDHEISAASLDEAFSAAEANARAILAEPGMAHAYSADADDLATDTDVAIIITDEDGDDHRRTIRGVALGR